MLGNRLSRRLASLSLSVLVLAAAAAFASTSSPEHSRSGVAVIDRAQGVARVERNGVVEELQSGHTITRRDHLSTGAGSRLSLTFNDGSRLALGENALVVVADFMAEEGRRSGALILDLVRGAIRLIASKPEQAPAKRVEVRTQTATIMSHHVDFWTGPMGDKHAVVVMRGTLNVRNEAGLVTLDRNRHGTLVANRSSPPDKPAIWPRDQARQSLMTVDFK